MDWWDVLLVVVRVVGVFALLMVVTVLLVWIERKLVADMQNRLGPMRAGPHGVLQTVADGLKLFFKEQITPAKSEFLIYMLAPALSVITAFLMFLVVPFARPFDITLGGEVRSFTFQAMDLNISVLYVLAISSIAVYAVVLAGWSSGSKYPLLGGVRATAQAISYEAAMGLSLVALIMFIAVQNRGGDVMSMASIVDFQAGTYGATDGFLSFLNPIITHIPKWFILPQVIPFVIFATAGVAETNRAPFDLVEAEQELVAGFHTEYSGMRFAMFFLAEYINMFTMSALMVTLFFGGWGGPFLDTIALNVGPWLATVVSFGYFMAKVFVFLFLFIWIRASFPRLRYDQLMDLGWKRLIPGALLWLIASSLALAIRQFGLPWT
ncbi:MAG: NADH-quinone oxidoreductase subunit H [Acidimicrobiia bacterium]|nr:NADH-quinone oxidoreductase subunit H [Acidimicrobiia bacterium]